MQNQKANKKRDLFLVAGGSRLGANIASGMSKYKKNVTLIDLDPRAFRKLNPDYSGYTVAGDATDISVLEQAGINRAYVVIAATNDDNTNIMISQIARVVFDVPTVIARLYSPDMENIGSKNGVLVVYPYKLSVDIIEQMLSERGCIS
ncbi:MAG: TrkA family potassium uptake protein [Dehalobacterium sp.]